MIAKFEFNDVVDFYNETDRPEIGSSANRVRELHDDDSDFRGLPNVEILQSKYAYKKGLDQLKEIELDFLQGATTKKNRWDENDGDEMSMERLNDSMPCMSQRVKRIGEGNGKFITLRIDPTEYCGIGKKEMLNKSYAAIQIADYLENAGYKVEIQIMFNILSPGSFKGNRLDKMELLINIKKAEEPLNKALLLTCISPWFFRYWVFKFMFVKLEASWGLGRPDYDSKRKDDKQNIYIYSGECLNPEKVKAKLESINKMFELNEEI